MSYLNINPVQIDNILLDLKHIDFKQKRNYLQLNLNVKTKSLLWLKHSISKTEDIKNLFKLDDPDVIFVKFFLEPCDRNSLLDLIHKAYTEFFYTKPNGK